MYKCSECGSEYNIKPKYCDCGNDMFIKTEDDIDFEPQEIDDIEEELLSPKRNNQSRIYKRKTFSPFAIIVFAGCIILSLLILFVIANPEKDMQDEKSAIVAEEKTENPSVDKYCDNTPVKEEKVAKINKEEEKPILDLMPKIVQEILPKEEPKKSVPQSPKIANNRSNPVVQSKNAPQNTKQKLQTPVQTSNAKTVAKAAASSKPASPSSRQNVMTFGDLTNKIRNQYSAQNTSSNTQSHNSSQTKVNAPAMSANSQSTPALSTNTSKTNINNTTSQTVVKTYPQTTQTSKTIQNTQTSQAPVVQIQPAKSQAQLRQELVNYKSGLRNNIARKIDFTKVIGDGECVLAFKINSSGRLTSKSFTVQSSNITLNDAAFNALNTTTSYNQPPEAYKGETLKLKIKFYNGNFEISLN